MISEVIKNKRTDDRKLAAAKVIWSDREKLAEHIDFETT